MRKSLKKIGITVLFSVASFILSGKADACTRVVYKGPNNTVITVRSMVFTLEIPANLWVFPRGIHRTGETGKNTIAWTSKYGNLSTSPWDSAVSCGMNDIWLIVNMFRLVS